MQGGAVIFAPGLSATADCNLTSPWYTPVSPSKVIDGEFQGKENVLQIRYSEQDNWTNLSAPQFTESNDDTIYRYQLRIVHNGSNTATGKQRHRHGHCLVNTPLNWPSISIKMALLNGVAAIAELVHGAGKIGLKTA